MYSYQSLAAAIKRFLPVVIAAKFWALKYYFNAHIQNVTVMCVVNKNLSTATKRQQ
jgi:hypothetical protein